MFSTLKSFLKRNSQNVNFKIYFTCKNNWKSFITDFPTLYFTFQNTHSFKECQINTINYVKQKIA